MFTKDKIFFELKKQLAIDYNCSMSDFDKKENILTLPAINCGRREYSEDSHFFSMVTLGENAIISANEHIHSFLKDFIKNKKGFWLFEEDKLSDIQFQLAKYGQSLFQSHLMFLPDVKPLNFKPDFETRWFEQRDIEQFYGDKRFPNAFCERYEVKRPDVLGICAVIDGEIAGMAGCSADSKIMWQIGIDVIPKFRRKGIGTILVGLLKDEIFKRGAIPFYGTGPANLHSQSIAASCGFYPAWVEIESIESSGK